MFTVREVMSKGVSTLNKGSPLKDAIHIMADKKIDYVLIMERARPIGIITVRDLLRKVLEKGKNFKTMKCKDIMTPKVKTVSPKDSVSFVSKMMKEFGIRRFPVVYEDKLVGMIDERNIVKATHSLHRKNQNVIFHHKIQMAVIILIMVMVGIIMILMMVK